MKQNKTYIVSFLLSVFLLTACSPKLFNDRWTQLKAPEVFKAGFETTKGYFEIEAHRNWSPNAVDRLYQLIKSEFYTDIALFRVVPNYVVQFGIHNEPKLNKAWKKRAVQDEPVKQANLQGTLSFARGGKESRTTQLFINLKNNSPRLDTLQYNEVTGFPVVANITKGMDVIFSFYDKYGGAPSEKQDDIQQKRNAFLKENFPKLDYIKKAYILD